MIMIYIMIIVIIIIIKVSERAKFYRGDENRQRLNALQE